MLSVSGLHVAIIFGAIELLFAVVRLPARLVAGGALRLTAVYVAARQWRTVRWFAWR